MKNTLLKLALPVAILLIGTFMLFLINLTIQISTFVEKFNPFAGQIVFWGLIVFYVGCSIAPLLLLLRLPKSLKPPPNEHSPAFEKHLVELANRLNQNRLISNKPVSGRKGIESALKMLDEQTNILIKKTASQVFIITSISQRGSLDALMVLFAESKLVWEIAHVYNQRPALRDMIYLYANVATTALVAGEIEDLDLSEQMEPIVSTALGSVAGAIPGLQQLSTIIISSVMNGTANAFLTLRVGIITKRYCNSLVVPEKKNLRKAAISEAATMLGAIAYEGTKTITGAFYGASKKWISNKTRGVGDYVKDTSKTLTSKIIKPKQHESQQKD